jgi:hypothetical protein
MDKYLIMVTDYAASDIESKQIWNIIEDVDCESMFAALDRIPKLIGDEIVSLAGNKDETILVTLNGVWKVVQVSKEDAKVMRLGESARMEEDGCAEGQSGGCVA